MNVIGHAIDGERRSAFGANGATEVVMDPCTNIEIQEWVAFLRRENDVIEEARVGMGHQAPPIIVFAVTRFAGS